LDVAREMRMMTTRALVWDANISARVLHTSAAVFNAVTPTSASRVREERR
jgi:hypothetical protein